MSLRVEVVAIGTELLLGQIVDTNSSWIGEQLALAGLDSHYQTKVGDNLDRMVAVLRLALDRSDAVICCGGVGPTQDDITREAIAAVMGVELVRDETIVGVIRQLFESRGRVMAENNARQADVPVGATVIPQTRGTAPGLICPVAGAGGEKVVYAVPGVPHEMKDMVARAIIPDLQRRAGQVATIRSRVIRTWGLAESALAERVAPRLDTLEASGRATIAFLASGIEGIKVRVTAKAATEADAVAVLDDEETAIRALLGDIVFGTDATNMEAAVGELLCERGLSLGLAESMTGGLVASRLVNVGGASAWFRGGVVAYDSQVKFDVLGVPAGPVVSEAAAVAMAEGARRVLGADVGLSVTGVAGPTEQEGLAVGTAYFGIAIAGRETEAVAVKLPGDRDQIRQFACISLLDALRLRLLRL